jgi:hypothetical protein
MTSFPLCAERRPIRRVQHRPRPWGLRADEASAELRRALCATLRTRARRLLFTSEYHPVLLFRQVTRATRVTAIRCPAAAAGILPRTRNISFAPDTEKRSSRRRRPPSSPGGDDAPSPGSGDSSTTPAPARPQSLAGVRPPRAPRSPARRPGRHRHAGRRPGDHPRGAGQPRRDRPSRRSPPRRASALRGQAAMHGWNAVSTRTSRSPGFP